MAAGNGTTIVLPLLDFDTGAGTDLHPAIGVYIPKAGGHVLVSSTDPFPVSGSFDETITETTDTQSLAAGAVNFLVSPGADFRLDYIAVHFSAALAPMQTLTIKLEPVAGAGFETIIKKDNLTGGTTDFFYQPEYSLDVLSGGSIRVQITNTATPAITARTVVATEAR